MAGRRPYHVLAFLAVVGVTAVLFRLVAPEAPPKPVASKAPPAPPAAESLPPVPKEVPRRLTFGDPAARPWLRTGWSVDEPGGGESYVWSDGPASVIELALPQDADIHLTFEGKPYGANKRAQAITVVLNGQTVSEVPIGPARASYSVTLPKASVRSGPNTLEFRYGHTTRPSEVETGSKDTRELAVCWYSLSLNTAPRQIRFGEESARAWMLEGWSRDERVGQNRYVWSDGARSTLELALPAGQDLRMNFSCQPYTYPGHPAQTVAIVLNGATVQTVTLEPGLQRYQARLPASSLRSGLNRLEFVYGYTQRPEVVERPSKDTRSLAVAWHSIEFDPAGGR